MSFAPVPDFKRMNHISAFTFAPACERGREEAAFVYNRSARNVLCYFDAAKQLYGAARCGEPCSLYSFWLGQKSVAFAGLVVLGVYSLSFVYRFRSVSCGAPGSSHDAGVLTSTSVYRQCDKLPKVRIIAASI